MQRVAQRMHHAAADFAQLRQMLLLLQPLALFGQFSQPDAHLVKLVANITVLA